MAHLGFASAFESDASIKNEADIGNNGIQASVEDLNDEYMVAAQLMNDSLRNTDDTEMADAVDHVSEVGGSSLSSGLSIVGLEGELGDSNNEPDQRASTPQSENGIDMLDKYAFNFNCGAYNHRVPQHLTAGTTLNVAKVNPPSITLAQHWQDLGEPLKKRMCPSLIPQQSETRPSQRISVECMWVGMLPGQTSTQHSNVPPARSSVDNNSHEAVTLNDTSKKPIKKKFSNSTSIVDLTEDNLTVVPFDRYALRVVAKKSSKTVKHWVLYALINPSPSSEICEAYKVSMDEVYFFQEFRDDLAKSYKPRKQATQEQIKARIFPPLPTSASLVSPGPWAMQSVELDETTDGQRLLRQVCSFSPSSARDIDTDKAAARSSTGFQAPRNLIQTSSISTAKLKSSKISGDCVMSAMMNYISKAGGPSGSDFEDVMKGNEDLDGSTGNLNATAAESRMEYDQSADYDEMDLDLVSHDNQNYPQDLIEESKNQQAIPSKSSSMYDKELFPRKRKSVSFQHSDGQPPGKHDKPLEASISGYTAGESHFAGDDGNTPEETTAVEDVFNLTGKINNVINRMAGRGDIASLEQALIVLKSLDKGTRPSRSSVLGLYLNVPAEGETKSHISLEDLQVRPTLVEFPFVQDSYIL